MEIKVIPDSFLRMKAKKMKSISEEDRRFFEDMFTLMKENEVEGVGLAAPQVGVLKRFVVIELEDFREVLINPVWEPTTSEKEEDIEGCLSVPGLYGPVERFKAIKVTFTNANGDRKTLNVDGLLARVVQHEVDHLDGVLFIDKITDWDRIEVMPLALHYPGVVELLKAHDK
jgi:peptide deformylase